MIYVLSIFSDFLIFPFFPHFFNFSLFYHFFQKFDPTITKKAFELLASMKDPVENFNDAIRILKERKDVPMPRKFERFFLFMHYDVKKELCGYSWLAKIIWEKFNEYYGKLHALVEEIQRTKPRNH